MNLPTPLPKSGERRLIAAVAVSFDRWRELAVTARNAGRQDSARFYARHARGDYRHLAYLLTGQHSHVHPTADVFGAR